MKRSLALMLATLSLLLAGCTTQSAPPERPYSDAQIKQFALEMLSRSNLPYEDYEKIRRALMNPTHRMSNAIKDVEATAPADANRS